MRVPFLTSIYGSFLMPQKQTKLKVYRSSNDSYFGTFNQNYYWYGHGRSFPSSNPIQLLDGLVPWRDKSNYKRNAWWFEPVTEGEYFVGASKTYYAKDSYLRVNECKNALLQGEDNPVFSGTTMEAMGSQDAVREANATAVTKALNDLASEKSTMGENLATMVQTVDSVADIGHDVLEVIRALRGLRRGRIPNIKLLTVRDLKRLVSDRKLEKRIANYWLAYWYGFKPLYEDAKGLIEVIQDAYNIPLLVHGRGRAQKQGIDSFTAAPTGTLVPAIKVEDSYNFQTYCTLTGKIRGSNGNIVRSLNRAGLANPASLAWELIPFSFVVDWVVPVGSVLNALSAPIGLDFVDGSLTRRWEREVQCTVADSHKKGEGDPAHTSLYGSGFYRDRLNDFPNPLFYTKPFFRGASRWATIAALISNLTRGL